MSESRKGIGPMVLFTILLLLLLLAGLWYFNNGCLTSTPIYKKVAASSVLGITSFTNIPDKTTVNAGDPAQFTVTNNANSLLSGGTLNFKLNGGGKIVSPIIGPGVCTVTSDTQAVCTNLNLNPNQDNTWMVNVQSDQNCLLGSTLGLDSTLSTLLDGQVGTQTANISCNPTTASTTPTPTPAPASAPTSTTTNTSSFTSTVLDDTDSDITLTTDQAKLAKQVLDRHNSEVAACLTSNTLLLGGAALLLYVLFILAMFFYMMGRMGKQTTVVTQTKMM